MKGIILSGGSGSRLFPITLSISKQIIPIYDKPMIYYPLSILMLAGIKDIIIITNKEHIGIFKNQLGDGSSLGIKISYEIQNKPNGIPEAFLISEKYINNQDVLLILGDNLFYGQKIGSILKNSLNKKNGAKIFLHQVKNPNEYGVVELNNKKKIKKIIEKPKKKLSDIAIMGIYFFDGNVSKYAKTLKPSRRRETEIVDLIKIYLKKNKLDYQLIKKLIWSDVGTISDYNNISNFVKLKEKATKNKIACLEEISLKNK